MFHVGAVCYGCYIQLLYFIPSALGKMLPNALPISTSGGHSSKRLVSMAEYPIRRLTFLVENHLDVGERNGNAVKALVVLMVFLDVSGIVVVGKQIYDRMLFRMEFLRYLPAVLRGIFRRFAV